MSDTQDTPIEASASGKNAYTIACQAIGQRMSYAACLNRLEAINTDSHPSDWNVCSAACKSRQCPAQHMREDEKTAGKSLFFIAREAMQNAAESARKWISTWNKSPAEKKRARTVSSMSMFDAMGELGSMADVINAAAKPAAPPPIARKGETPLQMARRLAAERNKQP